MSSGALLQVHWRRRISVALTSPRSLKSQAIMLEAADEQRAAKATRDGQESGCCASFRCAPRSAPLLEAVFERCQWPVKTSFRDQRPLAVPGARVGAVLVHETSPSGAWGSQSRPLNE